MKWFRKVSCELEILGELTLVHLLFYVFVLKKCIDDPVSFLPIQGLGVDENLLYE